MIRRMAVRYYLYNKRLFKKYSFLLILCMVPLLVGGIRLFAKEESGIATVVLCLTDGEDELAARAVGELTEEEKEEQAKLRKEYVALVHNNLRGQLQNISIQYPDGTVKPLKSKKEK